MRWLQIYCSCTYYTCRVVHWYLLIMNLVFVIGNGNGDVDNSEEILQPLLTAYPKVYFILVYTTQVNNTFRARWLASPEVISQVLFTSEQPKKSKMAFVAIFSQIKLLFGTLVIQLVWYMLKQLFTSVSVKVVDIYCGSVNIHHYSPPLRWIIVNYFARAIPPATQAISTVSLVRP